MKEDRMATDSLLLMFFFLVLLVLPQHIESFFGLFKGVFL